MWKLVVVMLVCQLLLTEHTEARARNKHHRGSNIEPRVRGDEATEAAADATTVAAAGAVDAGTGEAGAETTTAKAAPAEGGAAEDASTPAGDVTTPGGGESITDATPVPVNPSGEKANPASGLQDYAEGGSDVDETEELERLLEGNDDELDEEEYNKRQRDFVDDQGKVKGWVEVQQRDPLLAWSATKEES